MLPMIGLTLDHYRIESKLGEGGMGVVYKARDTKLGRPVALKILPAESVAHPGRKERFVQEARAASSLNHPNIITIYEIDTAEVEGRPVDFIAMEFVDGKPLNQLLGRQGLPLEESLRYAVQIADALAAAHAVGIVHRDLKPGNLMVTERGLVKVLDFGLAKLTEAVHSDDAAATLTAAPRTEEGTVMGTAAYMSPEQAEGKKVDGRSDVFSFGAVLYEMVTGRRAFSAESRMATLSAVLREEPKPVSELAETTPAELERIITRCLRKDAARRFQTMADLKVALEEVKEESASGKLSAIQAPAAAAPARPRWKLAAAAAAGGILAAAAATWFLLSRTEAPEPDWTSTPLTSEPGVETDPSFSPDGNQVAFAWNGPNEDNLDIYVKLIGPGDPLRLTTHPERDASPAWSPDGRWIAFLRRLSGDHAGVFLVPALGGTERQVAEVASPFAFLLSPSGLTVLNGPYLAWAPDNKRLIVMDREKPGAAFALFLLSIDTGERRRLTTPPEGILGDNGPAVSPDGRALLFARYANINVSEIYRLNLTPAFEPESELQRFPFPRARGSSPSWTPDLRQILFATREPGYEIWRTEASGAGQPRKVALPGNLLDHPVVSRSGQRLVYSAGDMVINIWRIDPLATGAAAAPLRVTSSTRLDFSPAYSPDGQKLAFVSFRSGAAEIWVCNRDGSGASQVTSLGGRGTDKPVWSPDGKLLAFNATVEGQPDIYVVRPEGGTPRRMTDHPAHEEFPRWSRDGRWLYFASFRTGDSQVWKIPSEGGDALQVTKNGGSNATESFDGKFLYYIQNPHFSPSLWRMPVEGGEEVQVLPELRYTSTYAVGRDGIYFMPPPPPGKESPVAFLSFATGRITTIARIPNPIFLGLSLSPDGRSLAFSMFDTMNADLMLVENFR